MGAVSGWSDDNFVKLNQEKTELIWLGLKKSQPMIQISVGSEMIHSKNVSSKFLGAYFHSTLNTDNHANNVCRYTQRRLFNLRELIYIMEQSLRLKLAKTLVLSLLDSLSRIIYGSNQKTTTRVAPHTCPCQREV